MLHACTEGGCKSVHKSENVLSVGHAKDSPAGGLIVTGESKLMGLELLS
jgi:hypothetical protein